MTTFMISCGITSEKFSRGRLKVNYTRIALASLAGFVVFVFGGITVTLVPPLKSEFSSTPAFTASKMELRA